MPIWMVRAGIEHTGQHCLTERPAVMELRAFERPAGVAVGIDVDHADRRFLTRSPSGSAA